MVTANPIEFQLPNGLTIAGLSWGDENAPKLLGVHGWLDNAATYSNLAKVLGDHFHFVAMDFAGHGHSGHRPAGVRYHLLDNVDDIIQFADALGWNQFNLMGHSMGAGVSTYVAASFPERIQSLILLEGVGTHATPEHDAPQVLRKAVTDLERTPVLKKPVYSSLADAVQARTSVVGSISSEAAQLLCDRGTEAIDSDRPDKGITWSSDPRLKMSSAIRLTEPLVEAFVAQIQADTLFVGAEQGFWAAMPAIEKRLSLIERLEKVTLPGNHHFHLEPDTYSAVADSVIAFLNR